MELEFYKPIYLFWIECDAFSDLLYFSSAKASDRSANGSDRNKDIGSSATFVQELSQEKNEQGTVFRERRRRSKRRESLHGTMVDI